MGLVNVNCLLVLVLCLVAADPLEAIFDHVKVTISNQLPNGAPFTIHCKSRDNDLGTHVIGAGQTYEFSFRINFPGTTLFFCGVGWQGGQVEFDIYRASYKCDGCYWEVREDFILGYIDGSPKPDVAIPWK
ncbi:hypothetical protein CRG98_048399 [Punica granatum]|uniref:S-protein homolog n=1 Tax=Punica granatum TaxID=22663 RepID=A0A2I0HHN9_PUNGR|nr:hypothetical protein CRG98_048399 [Punica granatum]